jgi:6-hydroxynicotinate 3-monooxygenase
VGAGIQQSPNALKVLRRLGLEERLKTIAFQPKMRRYREAASGATLWERRHEDEFERKYGAPHLLLHRAELHGALLSTVPAEIIQRSKKLVSYRQDSARVVLKFADGTTASADVVIAADGVHSIVREQMLGREQPRFTGRVAYRTTFPARLLGGLQLEDSTKWMSEDRHIVIYYVNPRKDEVYFVTSTPEADFNAESWSQEGDLDQLRAAYAGFHPEVRAVLAACPKVHKWALVERDPLPTWTDGRMALLGDACHPMTPYMAQGAATSIEDAAILARCLEGVGSGGVADALRLYERTRKPRTSWIQAVSSSNDIVQMRERQDELYEYDAWTAPLAVRSMAG